MKQGIQKDIDENGRVSIDYNNNDTAIKQVEITSELKQTDKLSGSNAGYHAGFDSDMNRLNTEANNAQGKDTVNSNGDTQQVNLSTTKNKQASAESKINGLSSKYEKDTSYGSSFNGNSGDFMKDATSSATGGNSIESELTEQERLSKKYNAETKSVNSDTALHNEYNSGVLSKDTYDLDCTDCGGWKTVTEEEITEKNNEMEESAVLSKEEVSSIITNVDINGEKKEDIYVNPRGSENLEGSVFLQDYYDYKHDANTKEKAGAYTQDKVSNTALSDKMFHKDDQDTIIENNVNDSINNFLQIR